MSDCHPFAPILTPAHNHTAYLVECIRSMLIRDHRSVTWTEDVLASQEQDHGGELGHIGQPLASLTCETRGSA
jgi:hypothetical protein